MLATLLGRFWFELAPSMGKAEVVRKNQQIALTLKMKEGLSLVALPHGEADGLKAGRTASSGVSGVWSRAMGRTTSGAVN